MEGVAGSSRPPLLPHHARDDVLRFYDEVLGMRRVVKPGRRHRLPPRRGSSTALRPTSSPSATGPWPTTARRDTGTSAWWRNPARAEAVRERLTGRGAEITHDHEWSEGRRSFYSRTRPGTCSRSRTRPLAGLDKPAQQRGLGFAYGLRFTGSPRTRAAGRGSRTAARPAALPCFAGRTDTDAVAELRLERVLGLFECRHQVGVGHRSLSFGRPVPLLVCPPLRLAHRPAVARRLAGERASRLRRRSGSPRPWPR